MPSASACQISTMASGIPTPSPSNTRQVRTTGSPFASGPTMLRTEHFSVVRPKEKNGPTVWDGVVCMLSLERSRLWSADHDVEFVTQSPLRLCSFHIEFCDHTFARFFVWDRLINRIMGKQ